MSISMNEYHAQFHTYESMTWKFNAFDGHKFKHIATWYEHMHRELWVCVHDSTCKLQTLLDAEVDYAIWHLMGQMDKLIWQNHGRSWTDGQAFSFKPLHSLHILRPHGVAIEVPTSYEGNGTSIYRPRWRVTKRIVYFVHNIVKSLKEK